MLYAPIHIFLFIHPLLAQFILALAHMHLNDVNISRFTDFLSSSLFFLPYLFGPTMRNQLNSQSGSMRQQRTITPSRLVPLTPQRSQVFPSSKRALSKVNEAAFLLFHIFIVFWLGSCPRLDWQRLCEPATLMLLWFDVVHLGTSSSSSSSTRGCRDSSSARTKVLLGLL